MNDLVIIMLWAMLASIGAFIQKHEGLGYALSILGTVSYLLLLWTN